MSGLLTDGSLVGTDFCRPVAVAIYYSARQHLAPRAGCCITAKGVGQVETIAVKDVAHAIARQLDGYAARDDTDETAYGWQHVLHGTDNGTVHLALVVVIGRKAVLGEVLGIGPRHVPHELHMQVGGVAQDEAFELCQIAKAAADTRQLAGLLEGDDVPLLIADDGL